MRWQKRLQQYAAALLQLERSIASSLLLSSSAAASSYRADFRSPAELPGFGAKSSLQLQKMVVNHFAGGNVLPARALTKESIVEQLKKIKVTVMSAFFILLHVVFPLFSVSRFRFC